jgi:hypothetical protein
MRGTILTASHFYVTSIVWFAVFVGATTAYTRFIDTVLGALGIDALLTTVVLLAMGLTTASAAAWLVWTTVRRDDRERVRTHRAAPALDPA